MAKRSLYDNITQANSEYVPNYIGSNYNEIAGAAKTLDERYRQNKDYSDKVAIMLAQENYNEADKHIKDNLAKSIYGQIDSISKSDPNFENSSAAVSQLARDFFTNEDRLYAIDNYRKTEEARSARNKLGANALSFGDNPDNFSTIDPTTGERRKFNNEIVERGDYSGTMQKLLGKVADDGSFTKPSGEKVEIDAVTRHFLLQKQYNNIKPEKLNRLVEALIPTYKQTAEGTQDIRRLTELEGYTLDPIVIRDGKTTRQTTRVDEDIRDRFRSLAAPQAFNKNYGKFDDFALGKGDTIPPIYGQYSGTLPGGVQNNTVGKFLPTKDEKFTLKSPDGKSYQFIDKRTGQRVALDELPKMSSTGATGGASPQSLIEGMQNYQRVEVDEKQVESEIRNNFSKLSTNLPGAESYYGDFDTYKKAYEQASKNWGNIAPSGVIIQPEQREKYNSIINATVASSPIHFKDQPAKGLKEFADQLGVPAESIVFEPISTFVDSPRKDLPGGYIEAKIKSNSVARPLPDKAPATVFIPLSDQFTELAAPIDNLLKNSYYQGTDTYTPENPMSTGLMSYDKEGRPIEELMAYTITYPKKDGSGFETQVFEGDKRPNGMGGFDIAWKDKPVKSSVWRSQMMERLSPKFNTILNSGQTTTAKDIKEGGVDF